MTILVTGTAGQLATALAQEGGPAIRRLGRPVLDFDNPGTIARAVHATAPSLVVNAAAWTAVDAAEAEPEAAARANHHAPAALARLCADARIPLIHISTDYVFDGTKGTPYTENDATHPAGAYGRTKLDGEHAVLSAWPEAVVLRTSWVYSATGRNFVRTMLAAAQRTDRLRVVADQRGCPTAARSLARAVLAVAARLREAPGPEHRGIFHAAGTGDTTWHGLATALFEDARPHGHPIPTVEPIRTQDWPTPARRPPDSRLDCRKLHQVFGIRLPPWRESLRQTVAELLEGREGRIPPPPG